MQESPPFVMVEDAKLERLVHGLNPLAGPYAPPPGNVKKEPPHQTVRGLRCSRGLVPRRAGGPARNLLWWTRTRGTGANPRAVVCGPGRASEACSRAAVVFYGSS